MPAFPRLPLEPGEIAHRSASFFPDKSPAQSAPARSGTHEPRPPVKGGRNRGKEDSAADYSRLRRLAEIRVRRSTTA